MRWDGAALGEDDDSAAIGEDGDGVAATAALHPRLELRKTTAARRCSWAEMGHCAACQIHLPRLTVGSAVCG